MTASDSARRRDGILMGRWFGILVTTALFACLGAAAMGQSINIDVGTTTSTEPGFGPPAATFGAAAASAGTWNNFTGTGNGPISLVGLNGQSTGVTISRTSGAGGNFAADNFNTDGDFERLFDDGQDLSMVAGGSVTYTISGLAAGTYNVFTYAIRPEDINSFTDVSVTGAESPNPQSVGGAMPFNGFLTGVTHSIHRVTLASGEPLVVMVATNAGAGFVSGIQIVAAQACCFKDGSCGDLTEQDCLNAGGTPQGIGSTCAATTCAAGCTFEWEAVDPQFNGPSAAVFAVTNWDPDGPGPQAERLVIGGSFASVAGVSAARIAAWDGAQWLALGSGMNNVVSSLTVYNGELIAGGFFTNAGGVGANRIARWNGAAWQPLGTGIIPNTLLTNVSALTVFNGELIAGGNFASAGGVTAPRIARWNGTVWQAAGTAPISGGTTEIRALSVYNNELIAGGQFTTIGGVLANRIARWNGSTWQPLGSGVDLPVRSLTTFGSVLIAGGEFTVAGGQSASRIARWNGSSWQALGSGIGATGFTPVVTALTVFNTFEGDELIAGGSFTTAGGVAASRIARWDEMSWRPLGSGTTGEVHALRVHNDRLIVGGSFSDAGGAGTPFLARWGPEQVHFTQHPVALSRCVGDAAGFSAAATGDGMLLYQWRRDGVPLNDGGHISGANSATLTLDPVGQVDAGEYDVIVSSGACARTSQSAALFVQSAPAPDAGGPYGTCETEPVSLAGSAGHYSSVNWSTLDGTGFFVAGNTFTPTYSPSEADAAAGSVTLVLTAYPIAPCTQESISTATLTLHANPTCTIVASPGATVCSGTIVTLDAGEGFVAYRWTTDETSRTIEVTAPGVYGVSVTDVNGCQGTCEITITLTECDDGNPCTDDSCDTLTGQCMHTPVDCDDGEPCTDDSCDPLTGKCVHTPRVCDDGNPCTEDSCDPLTGECVFTPVVCDDGDPCTDDSCDPLTGECIFTPRDCDDGDACTEDMCDPLTGECLHIPQVCDDDDPCTDDTCDPLTGECIFTPRDCNDGDPCTFDSCDPETGDCLHEPIPDCECTITLALELAGTGFAAELERCIRFELFPRDCGAPSTVIEHDVMFVDGAAAGVVLTFPCGDYSCLTARDPLHTLARTIDPLPYGVHVVADYTGEKALTVGNFNGDDDIDIIDFAIVMNRFGDGAAAGTTCEAESYHADVNGDEVVDSNDMDFVLMNFFQQSDPGCCVPMGLMADPAFSVSCEELERRNMGEMNAADLNADGVVDMRDVAMFFHGVRPVRSATSDGTKPARAKP